MNVFYFGERSIRSFPALETLLAPAQVIRDIVVGMRTYDLEVGVSTNSLLHQFHYIMCSFWALHSTHSILSVL